MSENDEKSQYNMYDQTNCNGIDVNAEKYFGVHRLKSDKKDIYQYVFRACESRAIRVELMGKFITSGGVIMQCISKEGVFETVVESDIPLEGMGYKYRITTGFGSYLTKDKYALYSEYANNGWSIIRTEPLARRQINGEKRLADNINIYKTNLNEWQNCTKKRGSNYRDMAHSIAEHVLISGHSYIELQKLTDKTDEISGNVCFTLFSPSALYGTPDDFRFFIDIIHENGIGVIIELIPNEFARDYFSQFAAKEAYSYLISAVLFWCREYNIDGVCLSNNSDNYFYPDLIATLKQYVKKEFPNVILLDQTNVNNKKE